MITSSPLDIPIASKAASSATEPFATAIPYLRPTLVAVSYTHLYTPVAILP